MTRVRFVWKVFGGAVLVILLTSAILTASITSTIEHRMTRQTGQVVRRVTGLVAELVEADLQRDELDTVRLQAAVAGMPGGRVTVLDVDGGVLYDSHEDPGRMLNHAERQEILEPGSVVRRRSRTLGIVMTYCAMPVELDGELAAFARVAVSAEAVEARIADVREGVLNGALLSTAIGLVLAYVFARRVTRPLSEVSALIDDFGRGNTTRRMRISGGDEFQELAQAVNSMFDELEQRLARIRRDRSQREAVMTALTEGVLAVDRSERVRFINNEARELLSAGDGDLRNVPVRELTRIPEVGQIITRCLEEGRQIRGEATLARREGERVIELGASPFSDEEGETHGCVLALHDVSEVHRLEGVRRDFVANVSHELKTPLTSMRGFLETVIEDPEMAPGDRQRFLQRAYDNTERLAAIVTDLLSLARLESAGGALAFEATDVAPITGTIVREHRNNARDVTVAFEMPEEPARVNGDRRVLHVAISNLVDNAVKYTREGTEVEVRIELTPAKVRVLVTDQGTGIAASEQERIFERFYRVDRDRSRLLGGTGLGLAIVRHVARAHQGSVTVESMIGRGSTFCLELPRMADEPSNPATETSEAAEPAMLPDSPPLG